MSKDIHYSKSIQKLEEIVEKLENGNLDLDQSMELLTQGLKLHKMLEDKLKKSQNKIEKIISSEEVT